MLFFSPAKLPDWGKNAVSQLPRPARRKKLDSRFSFDAMRVVFFHAIAPQNRDSAPI